MANSDGSIISPHGVACVGLIHDSVGSFVNGFSTKLLLSSGGVLRSLTCMESRLSTS